MSETQSTRKHSNAMVSVPGAHYVTDS